MEGSVKVRLGFQPTETVKPFIHLFATRFGLIFSILQADISPDRGGYTILDLNGEMASINTALDYAREQGIKVSILSRAVHWDDHVCVHCGACTAVCLQQALTLDPSTAMLRFDNAKCVLCEMCISACPTSALKIQYFNED